MTGRTEPGKFLLAAGLNPFPGVGRMRFVEPGTTPIGAADEPEC